MLTKIPDYIISDCGNPEWDSESQQLCLAKINVRLWRNSTIGSSKSIKITKLLPLRESLTDFYIGMLSIQKEFIHKTQFYYKNNNKQQAKNQVKELTNGKGDMRIRQQQCPLDKRKSQTSADNDLDQF